MLSEKFLSYLLNNEPLSLIDEPYVILMAKKKKKSYIYAMNSPFNLNNLFYLQAIYITIWMQTTV